MTGHSALFKYLIFSFLFLLSSNLRSQVYPDPNVDSLLKEGIRKIAEQNYNEARSIFAVIDNKYPSVPLGKIYLAAVEIAYAYDFEIPFNEKIIEDYLKQARVQSERLLEQDQQNKWHVYFYALAGGYNAYYIALKGNWFEALKIGLSSVSAFEKCLELDPGFYESWIAIGTYEYWKSRKTEFLSWLPFINDNRIFAVEKLRLAIDSSVYNNHIAIHSLIWIYIDQGDFESALNLSKIAVEKFPDSRVFKWALARAFEEIDLRKSIEIYQDIISSYKNAGIRSRVNEITLKHIIAQQYYKLNDKKNALRFCNEILAVNDYTQFERERLTERLERVRKLSIELK